MNKHSLDILSNEGLLLLIDDALARIETNHGEMNDYTLNQMQLIEEASKVYQSRMEPDLYFYDVSYVIIKPAIVHVSICVGFPDNERSSDEIFAKAAAELKHTTGLDVTKLEIEDSKLEPIDR